MDEERSIAASNYNYEEGKLVASIKWLITKIYENKGIPDKLHNPFHRTDDDVLQLTSTILTVLTNGSLYVQAAAKILHDNSLLTQSHGAVIRALSSVDVEVRDSDGTFVTESMLSTVDPFRTNAHLAMLDALMTTHVKSIVSIERVVQVVSEYTSVDKREEPLDFLDALLFWINKICLLVRDDVERHDVPLKGADNCDATIPEMEDLYEDLCDGTCICALMAFYRPNELNLQDISFSDPISIQDCRYNLSLLKNSLDCLPWNPFHFEIDDILYLHESLQPNVNAFLADLFQFFEPIPIQSPVQATSPVQRRFVPIEAIPDLRASNLASRPTHPPRMRNTVGLSQRDRTMSVASGDSHLTSMSGDSLRYNSQRPTTLPANVNIMNFRQLQQANNGTNDPADLHTIAEPSNMASVRLALQERRREYDRKRCIESSMNEEERQKAGKDAFFKLMSKNMENTTNQHAQSAEPNKSNDSPYSTREEQLSAQVQNLQVIELSKLVRAFCH
uniref:Calponin-homology (CH) domain-containing protein n=1 Tax=Acrobeloides nanus TaxID=290746 RepID=A0A914BWG2_9BILA